MAALAGCSYVILIISVDGSADSSLFVVRCRLYREKSLFRRVSLNLDIMFSPVLEDVIPSRTSEAQPSILHKINKKIFAL